MKTVLGCHQFGTFLIVVTVMAPRDTEEKAEWLVCGAETSIELEFVMLLCSQTTAFRMYFDILVSPSDWGCL